MVDLDNPELLRPRWLAVGKGVQPCSEETYCCTPALTASASWSSAKRLRTTKDDRTSRLRAAGGRVPEHGSRLQKNPLPSQWPPDHPGSGMRIQDLMRGSYDGRGDCGFTGLSLCHRHTSLFFLRASDAERYASGAANGRSDAGA